MKSKQPEDGRHRRDRQILRRFIQIYCRHHHSPGKGCLCPDCRDLQSYALGRLERCPMDPKPKCKDCPVHCYKPEYRARIREVMKFSGIHLVKRGRVDWLVKYFLSSAGSQMKSPRPNRGL
jgi:hypothetical protein